MTGSTNKHPLRPPLAVRVLLEAEPTPWLGPGVLALQGSRIERCSGAGSASPQHGTIVATQAEPLGSRSGDQMAAAIGGPKCVGMLGAPPDALCRATVSTTSAGMTGVIARPRQTADRPARTLPDAA